MAWEIDREEIKKDLSIDKHNLDSEWEQQALRVQKWTERAADAGEEERRTKDNVEFRKSELDEDIRKNYKSYGFEEPPKEGAIKVCIFRQEQYKVAMDEYISAKKILSLIEGIVKSLDHKKSGLKDEVQLWMSGYWAEPRIPQAAKERVSSDVSKAITADLQNDPGMARQRLRRQNNA